MSHILDEEYVPRSDIFQELVYELCAGPFLRAFFWGVQNSDLAGKQVDEGDFDASSTGCVKEGIKGLALGGAELLDRSALHRGNELRKQ